jgi:DNA replication initiation complex subunit (GINS family)
MEEIKVTLETLYDILRNEKKHEDLQKLEASFFIDVVSYLREKAAILNVKEDSDSLFASGEKEKLEYELRSIRRILKEIYEKREKKIIDITLNRSRTGSDIIDTSAMLREEKIFYEKLLKTLDQFRIGILGNLFKSELPDVFLEKRETVEVKKEPVVPSKSSFTKYEGAPEVAAEDDNEESSDESDDSEDESSNTEEKDNNIEMTKIKFLHPVPSFVWKDMKIYGPYDSGEETEIFPEVAELLVRKGRAEKVS